MKERTEQPTVVERLDTAIRCVFMRHAIANAGSSRWLDSLPSQQHSDRMSAMFWDGLSPALNPEGASTVYGSQSLRPSL